MSRWDAHVYDTSFRFVSEHGKELITLLKPQKGELILDIGCGTGEICHEIAQSGARVIGIDNSETMLERARQKWSDIEYLHADVSSFSLAEKADAIFSNAALHWVVDQRSALTNIYYALKPGGRMVAELGGKGNVKAVLESIQTTIERAGYQLAPLEEVFYFPSIAEYACLLEEIGFEVELCHLFPRFTPLNNPNEDYRNWINVFGILLFKNVPLTKRTELIAQAADLITDKLIQNDRYFVDYVRLRVVAHKPEASCEI
ncbi:MAG: methyltransferase domain-containing protein [Candidatus Caenarcaniphilales bacterium]|nr:methyltransferase domain-containing protein [Candidatus Caenarcaniphilales bacterium]